MRAADYPFFRTRFAAFAHRGGALLPRNVGIENSLKAFENAVELGYTHLETDVHITRDGVLFAFHDDVLDRVTDGHGPIEEHTSAHIARLRVGGTEPIPKLDDLLEAFPDAKFNIDIKSGKAVEPLAKAIDWHRAHDRVCVSSFGVDRIRAFRKLVGRRVATAVSAPAIGWNSFVPLLPRVLNSPGVALQMPVTHEVGGRTARLLTRRLLRNAHAAGKVIHVWTIDGAEAMNALIDLGVDGIFTDRPDVLKDVLCERGLWEGTR